MHEKVLVKRLLLFLKPHKIKIANAIFCMIAGSGLTSAQAYMIKPLLDEIFVNKDRWMLNVIPFALIMLFLLKGFFNYFSNSLLDTLGQTIIRDLRKNIFSHIHSLPISFFHNTPTGELIARVINDSALVQQAVSRALAGVFKDLFQVIGLVCVVVYLNWKLALVGLIFLPLAFLPVAYFGRKFRKLSTTNQQTVAQISNILHETITGHKIVKAFSMERYETKRFSETVDKLFSVIVKDIKNNSLQSPIMELLGGISITAIIWYGGHQVINGHSTPGIFFAFLTSIIMIYNPIKGVSNINSALQQGLAATARIFSLLDTQSSICDKAGAISLPPFQKNIKFNNLSFSYDGKAEALKNINLTVTAGEVIALVGTSGGGKTTLVNLIPRFFDATSGSITIDDHDLRDVTMESLRNQIAIVSQQTILFNDTVKNNIAYGDQNRSLNEIIAAAKAAHALDFINELPEGFDTVIGESGARLSGGQQQRISIARALLKNAPILILDEATSALDTESEREVQKALENLMKDRTTFVIAHRLSTIRNADRIIVIQEGKMVEEGDHQTMLKNKGAYYMLHDRQH
ncbi:MAG: lipid A export permease/ATP-binding protein MsbA [Desulfurivibrionaceae bacterium]